MLTLQTLWRGVRFPLILITVLVLGLGTWVTWALTDQRYQRFLTQQISNRLATEVQIGTSRVTVRRGLGIAFANVTIRDRPDVTPLFTANTIDVFLDFSSLLRGHFDFRQVTIIKPTLHVIEGMKQEAIFHRFHRETTQPEPATQESKGWFTPRFTLQQLTVEDGTVTYSRDTSTAPLFFTQINATVAYTEMEVITAQLETDIGQGGELSTLTLHTRSQEGGA
jgi:hypothetical protein